MLAEGMSLIPLVSTNEMKMLSQETTNPTNRAASVSPLLTDADRMMMAVWRAMKSRLRRLHWGSVKKRTMAKINYECL